MQLQDLLLQVEAGTQFKYLYFWGHRPRPDGLPSDSCFSQWYAAPFKIDGKDYPTAEHYMMAGKARLFDDASAETAILASTDPAKVKALGRKVKNYNEETWCEHRFQIVVDGNHAKFSQNAELRDYLLKTGDKVIVEASPVDPIWGIGLSRDDPAAQTPATWKGLNLLGFALMEVRDRLRA
jgi:ribA/ribD-fused uncharacterized protein